MKTIGKIWNGTSLIVKILIGLVLGALFGLLTPQATFLGILGELFVGALKGIAPLLVFVLVISSLANATGGIGKRFTTVIALYLASTPSSWPAAISVPRRREGSWISSNPSWAILCRIPSQQSAAQTMSACWHGR